MNTLNKVFHPDDYLQLKPQLIQVEQVLRDLDGYYDLQHYHRRWEYCMALRALELLEPETVLDVGSYISPFPAMVKLAGYDITGSDLRDRYAEHDHWPFDLKWINLKRDMTLYRRYDVVTSVSVIEHVKADKAQLEMWWSIAHRGMVITFDASDTGEKLVPHHLRSYTIDQMIEMVEGLPGAKLLGNVDKTWPGPLIPPGNFGCVAIQKNNKFSININYESKEDPVVLKDRVILFITKLKKSITICKLCKVILSGPQ
jgi:hypothetical protein